METLAHKYKTHFTDKAFVMSFILSFVMLLASFVINFYAGTYATMRASNAVTDLILDNIPVFDVDLIFIYGPLVLWIFVSLLLLDQPKRIPFTIKSVALFVLVRSAFITLTHIGPFPTQTYIDYSGYFIGKFAFGGDLFFSGHTGLPFLLALVFWKNKFLRILFIVLAIFFGAIVLMGHLHYSIDVLSAFFITYSIYHTALVFFKKDAIYFNESFKDDVVAEKMSA